MQFWWPSFELLAAALSSKDIEGVFDALLIVASDASASDIHIEPTNQICRMRVRIDWVMHHLIAYDRAIHDNIIAKFKIESGQMRPDEKRLPQDARVSTQLTNGKELDMRANTIPTVYGEKLVLRIVDKSNKTPTLDDIGLQWQQKEILLRNIASPNGIVLVTWPTGSGKTTTLYACLQTLNSPTLNITTFEDPVEIKVAWLNQAQIKADIWFTFAQWLRWSLRQDPDVIMVWEIRDRETLDAAMEASMTWHLVFSTVHTNSAAETITRMINLGAQSYMLAWTITLIVAQRLARKLHPDHTIIINAQETMPLYYERAVRSLRSMHEDILVDQLKKRNISPQRAKEFFEHWLVRCSDPSVWLAWLSWRTAFYEMLEFDTTIKEMLLQWSTVMHIEQYARQSLNMIDLEQDALFKVLQWEISLDEVYRLVKHHTVHQ
jgi:type IV pilus assembly protein PilB